MKKEIKVCLPLYKVTFSVLFMVILALVRGIFYVYEIGIAMEPPVALLSAALCADAYVTEIQNGRAEVFCLYAGKKKSAAILRRLFVTMGFLTLLSAGGYLLFYWQRPIAEGAASLALFGEFMFACLGTILFWGMLAQTISSLLRNMWAGIGVCFLVWQTFYSVRGEKIFGKWNLFSYVFRDIGGGGSDWLCGQFACFFLAALMLPAVRRIVSRQTAGGKIRAVKRNERYGKQER